MNDAERRVGAALPAGTEDRLAQGLAASDLRTLLLAVARARASAVGPADLVRAWRSDRFVRPSRADPRGLAALEARLWAALPGEFDGVALSPVTPLGTSAALGPVSQDKIISTTRLTEVVSDPTNVLALEAAARRRAGAPVVHLATCQRVVRAQPFPEPNLPHFTLFALVSTARDRGSRRTEAELLIAHLRYWSAVLAEHVPATGRIELSAFDDPALVQRIADTVHPAVAGPLHDAPERTRARGYYTSGALSIHADGVEVGDGGFTDWTAALLSDAKERCLISCLSTERLAAVGGSG